MLYQYPLSIRVAAAAISIPRPGDGSGERGFDGRSDRGAEVDAVVCAGSVEAAGIRGSPEVLCYAVLVPAHLTVAYGVDDAIQRPSQYSPSRRRHARRVEREFQFRFEFFHGALERGFGRLLFLEKRLIVRFLG